MRRYINQIDDIWENKFSIIKNHTKFQKALNVIQVIINDLDIGIKQICNKVNGKWEIDVRLKKAVILYLFFQRSKIVDFGEYKSYDKVPLKFTLKWESEDFERNKLRIVPGGCIRKGAYLGKGAVIMPSFINIGVYIGDNTMVDSMSTIGSCAYIGKNCHISSNTTIAGVLEPIQNSPVIIEDNCFIGSNCCISEGVIVSEGSVIAAGTTLTSSVKIYDKLLDKIYYGHIPQYSVVVPGILPSSNKDHPATICAIIIKKVDEQTRKKVNINDLLRES